MRTILPFAVVLAMAQQSAPTGEYFLSGNTADVQRRTEAGFVLMGGGKDVDAAFEWMIGKSGGGDFVVVRASGADGYNEFVQRLGSVDSVESLVIKTPDAARDPLTLERIRHAEALFIAGGDQWNYVNIWGPSPVRDAIQGLIARGIPVGGTSAGLAVLGEFAFSAEKDSVTSAQALQNPFDERITIARDFLKIDALRGIITDSHFVRRDRMGRLLVFLARILQDGKAAEGKAIALDERTAALVSPGGAVAIEGEGTAYFVRGVSKPEICKAGVPLTWRSISVYRCTRGNRFDLKTWRGEGGIGYTLSVDAGVVKSSQEGGSLY